MDTVPVVVVWVIVPLGAMIALLGVRMLLRSRRIAANLDATGALATYGLSPRGFVLASGCLSIVFGTVLSVAVLLAPREETPPSKKPGLFELAAEALGAAGITVAIVLFALGVLLVVLGVRSFIRGWRRRGFWKPEESSTARPAREFVFMSLAGSLLTIGALLVITGVGIFAHAL